MDEEYCHQCNDFVPVTDYGEKVCYLCNPQYMKEDDYQELDFRDELYDRLGD